MNIQNQLYFFTLWNEQFENETILFIISLKNKIFKINLRKEAQNLYTDTDINKLTSIFTDQKT